MRCRRCDRLGHSADECGMPLGSLRPVADAEQLADKIRAEMGWTRGTRRRSGGPDPLELARLQVAEERARRAEQDAGRPADPAERPDEPEPQS